MKKIILAFLVVFSLSSCDEILDVLVAGSEGGMTGITQGEAASGIKQALEKGVLAGTA